MAVEVALKTPLAEALSEVVQPKLSEIGWNTGGADDSALGEYIILMLVNGKTQEQIAAELSNDLLNLEPDNSGATDFSRWLFEQVDILNKQLNGSSASHSQTLPQAQVPSFQPDSGRPPGAQRIQTVGSASSDVDMGEGVDGVQDGLNIPTGPKSMRNGNAARNGNRRLIGQLSKAMDRSNESALHRVRLQSGTERISRLPPKGPRANGAQNQRIPSNAGPMGIPMPGMQPGLRNGLAMPLTPAQQMQMLAFYEEQARMMSQILAPQNQRNFMPAMPQPAINPGFQNGAHFLPPQPGRSLFERVEPTLAHQNRKFIQRQQQPGVLPQHSNQPRNQPETTIGSEAQSKVINGDASSSMEVDSSQNASSGPSPDTVCKFNLLCTKKDCIFAHQSPAAPAGTTIDVNDQCPFGAACKNRKCVARHPSPAQKVSHQAEQDCKFFPKCTNPACPFRHPNMPMCRNGADCKLEGCKFTHIKTMCKYNPCLNPACEFKHVEGQKRGVFDDKVWMAQGNQEKGHVSERKFVDDTAVEEELILPGENPAPGGSRHSSVGAEVVT